MVDVSVIDAARAQVARLMGETRSPHAWDADRPGLRYDVHYHHEVPELDALIDQPKLHEALSALFGELGFDFGPTEPSDPHRRHMALWVNPFDPDAEPGLNGFGHVDSGDPRRGIAIHLALGATRPYGGNTTYIPGSHRVMHRWLDQHPDPSFPGGVYPEVAREMPPWEFIAQPGDLVLTHHLVFHSANASCADDRSPRLAIRQEVFSNRPPALDGPSAFERSLMFQ